GQGDNRASLRLVPLPRLRLQLDRGPGGGLPLLPAALGGFPGAVGRAASAGGTGDLVRRLSATEPRPSGRGSNLLEADGKNQLWRLLCTRPAARAVGGSHPACRGARVRICVALRFACSLARGLSDLHPDG